MNLVCKSILTLIVFYVLYSECITLPSIIKKNKKFVYLLIGFVYLSTYDTYDTVEGLGAGDALKSFAKAVAWALAIAAAAFGLVVALSVGGVLIAAYTG